MLKFEPKKYKTTTCECRDFFSEAYATCLVTDCGERFEFYDCTRRNGCKNYCGDKCQIKVREIK